jgi:parvulin-like peptidyl-prolyl isomerase
MIVQIMRRREFMLAEQPTPADVFQRFKQEEKKLSFPGSVELALVKLPLNDKENAAKITDALKKTPGLWEKIVLQYPITPGSNGRIGSVELPQLRSEFAKAMSVIVTDRIYSNIQTADGIYFIKVLKYLPPRKAVFKDHAETVRKKMEEEIYRKSAAAYAARLRSQAVIEYFFPVPEGGEKK